MFSKKAASHERKDITVREGVQKRLSYVPMTRILNWNYRLVLLSEKRAERSLKSLEEKAVVFGSR